MAANDVTTLTELKLYMGASAPSSSDALLSDLIESVSQAIANYIEYPLISAIATEVYDGNGAEVLFLRRLPVIAISEVKTNGLSIPPSTGFSQSGYVAESNLCYLRGRTFPVGFRNVEITYTAGWADVASIPADIKQVANELVALRYKERDWTGYQSKSLAGETVTFTSHAFSKNCLDILNNYRRIVPV